MEEAILVYQAILNGEKDETVDEKFTERFMQVSERHTVVCSSIKSRRKCMIVHIRSAGIRR